MRIPPILAAALLLGGFFTSSATAQITHDVDVGPGFDFVPADITIALGDTVRWTWIGGIHDVKSGTGGISDGIFDSGTPSLPPLVFQVTFDSAFLAANPVPANVYNYFCSIHVSFAMEGSVTVLIPPSVTPYGCLNPAGSLSQISGAPTVGGNWTIGVDNPIPGGQPPGSLAFVSISLNAAPGFPCGLPIPSFHMDPTQPAGELLIGLAPPDPIVTLGPVVWAGTGTPAQFAIALPPFPTLAGYVVHVQGLILDLTMANTFGATDGLKVTIGS